VGEFDYSLLRSYGKNVYISNNVEIKRPHLVSLGHNIAIDSYFVCTTQLDVADYCHISYLVSVIGGEKCKLILDNFCSIAAGSRFICASEKYNGDGLISPLIPEKYRDDVTYSYIIMKRFSSVCTNCIIFPGVTINEGSVIGAGSIITKNTIPWTIYANSMPIKDRPKDKILKYAKEFGL